ncbi:MAG: hypothetical protein RR265_08505 [Cetobacterium sp.]|uniref:hypothetical protein n=1 Tax=Cetobacterium sp. TaxID=2071632 RepID=UPI002FCC452E
MNKQELIVEQKQKVVIGSHFGIVAVIGIIISIICFAIRSTKFSQLSALKEGTITWNANHIALESTILICNIISILYAIIAIGCMTIGCLVLYNAGVFNTKKGE